MGRRSVDEFEEMDSDQSTEVSRKLTKLLNDMQQCSEVGLRAFSVDELQYLRDLYGHTFVYAIYRDIDYVLSLPQANEVLH